MPFLLVDDGFDEHRKIEALTHPAYRLHHIGLTHCSRNLTDGLVTEAVVRGICARYRITKRHIAELVAADLWTEYPGHGFIIKNYLDWNPTAAEVKAKREKRASAGRLGGRRSGEARAQAKAKQVLGLVVEPHPIPSPSSSAL